MSHNYNDNRYTQTFAIVDVETLFLLEDYARYQKLDNRAADIRWPFKSVCSAGLLTFSVDADGIFSFGRMQAWAGDDEGAIVRQLFCELRMIPDATLTTWGGLNLDLPVLRLAAMRHHLRLPAQLVHNARRYGKRCHLDLVTEMKAGGQSYTHLSEIATALKLPCKFGDRASKVPLLLKDGKLRRLQDIALADCIATALVLQAHLECHGDLVSSKAAQITTLREVVSRRPEAAYAEYLQRVERRLTAEAMNDAEAFIASAA